MCKQDLTNGNTGNQNQTRLSRHHIWATYIAQYDLAIRMCCLLTVTSVLGCYELSKNTRLNALLEFLIARDKRCKHQSRKSKRDFRSTFCRPFCTRQGYGPGRLQILSCCRTCLGLETRPFLIYFGIKLKTNNFCEIFRV